MHRPVYIISGGNPNHLPNAVVVAQAFTKLGVAVTIVEHGMKGFPDGVRAASLVLHPDF